LQRLYSSFARVWPGSGLLCLRVITTIVSVHYALAGFSSEPMLWLRMAAEIAAGLLLCAGLRTPVAGGALSIVALWSVLSGTGDPWAQILLASVGAALAMLGPGAWSIDARLFGRKRLIHNPGGRRFFHTKE